MNITGNMLAEVEIYVSWGLFLSFQSYKSLRGNVSDIKGILQMLLPLGQNQIRSCAKLSIPSHYFY